MEKKNLCDLWFYFYLYLSIAGFHHSPGLEFCLFVHQHIENIYSKTTLGNNCLLILIYLLGIWNYNNQIYKYDHLYLIAPINTVQYTVYIYKLVILYKYGVIEIDLHR